MIDWQYVDSSHIEAIGYCAETGKLYVRFLGSREYVYHDVDSGVFEEFLQAGSKGGYLHRHIRDRYAYDEL